MATIEGKQIRLRDIQLKDLPTFRYWQQPGRLWQTLDGPYYPKSTAEKVDAFIGRIEARIKEANWPEIRQRLFIADYSTDTLLGSVSWYWISEETNWAAIGIVIFDPDAWGKGIGYESLGLWSDYLLTRHPEWVRLDLRTWSGNHGMVGLAKKLGFQEEARFRDARIVDGSYYDGLGYGILRGEWAAQFPNGFAGAL